MLTSKTSIFLSDSFWVCVCVFAIWLTIEFCQRYKFPCQISKSFSIFFVFFYSTLWHTFNISSSFFRFFLSSVFVSYGILSNIFHLIRLDRIERSRLNHHVSKRFTLFLYSYTSRNLFLIGDYMDDFLLFLRFFLRQYHDKWIQEKRG